jgi:thiamine-phosphate diphosphorylase
MLFQQVALVKQAVGDSVRLIVNGSIGVAHFSCAEGVQLPEAQWRADGAICRAKQLGLVVGASVHSLSDAQAACEMGADYLVVGTIFDSLSHPGAPGVGLACLNAICRNVRVPVVAIGGVAVDNAMDCILNGAAGVAVLSPIMRDVDPQAMATAYASALGISTCGRDKQHD